MCDFPSSNAQKDPYFIFNNESALPACYELVEVEVGPNSFCEIRELRADCNISTYREAAEKEEHKQIEILETDLNSFCSSASKRRSNKKKKTKHIKTRNPESWKQNIRKQLCQKGLPYTNSKGIVKPGKTIGPSCASSCLLKCPKNITNEQRRKIHEDFWNLSTEGKRKFYGNYVKKCEITRRSSKCKKQADPRKKQTFRYYLNAGDETVQVCKVYFINTLAVSEATISYYFKNFHGKRSNEMMQKLSDRGRKGHPLSRIQEIKKHIYSLPKEPQLSVPQMYNLYKVITENPVGIESYRRVYKTLLLTENNDIQSDAKKFKKEATIEPINNEADEPNVAISHILIEDAEADFNSWEVAVNESKNDYAIIDIDEEFNYSSIIDNEISEVDVDSNSIPYNASEIEIDSVQILVKEAAVKKIEFVPNFQKVFEIEAETMPMEVDNVNEHFSLSSHCEIPTLKSAEKKKRSRNPELWKQNIRKQLCEKGLPFTNNKGIVRPGKKLGPTCAQNCFYSCTTKITNEERLKIHQDFWNLSTQEKRQFYGNFVKKLKIKRRRKLCTKSNDPKKKQTFQYYLKVNDQILQVCKTYFLNTLAISQSVIFGYFIKFHGNDSPQSKLKPTKRVKNTSTARLQKVKNHISSFPSEPKLSVLQMYNIYKATTDNPVYLETYQRIFNTLTSSDNMKLEKNTHEIVSTPNNQENIVNSKSFVESNQVVGEKQMDSPIVINEAVKEEFEYIDSIELDEVCEAETVSISNMDGVTETTTTGCMSNFAELAKSEIFDAIEDDLLNADGIQVPNSNRSTLSKLTARKKLERNSKLWKQNVRKQFYERKGIEKPRKLVGQTCSSNCLYKCFNKISNEERQIIHSEFWKLSTMQKRKFYDNFIEKCEIKRRSKLRADNVDSKKENSFRYHLKVGEKIIQVCKKYFHNTLAISEGTTLNYFQCYHQGKTKTCKNSNTKFIELESNDVESVVEKSDEISKAELNDNVKSFTQYQLLVMTDENNKRKRRSKRNPALWKQNIRKSLHEKGLPYINREGFKRPGRVLGPTCPLTCYYLCTKIISYEKRQQIHKDFWKLTLKEKRNFFGKFVIKCAIKRRSKACAKSDDPKKKNTFRYHLPIDHKESVQVCKRYFLNTLSISEKTISYYFNKYHGNDSNDFENHVELAEEEIDFITCIKEEDSDSVSSQFCEFESYG